MGILNNLFKTLNKVIEPEHINEDAVMGKTSNATFISQGNTCKEIYDKYKVKVGIGTVKRSVFECNGRYYIKGTIDFYKYESNNKYKSYKTYENTVIYKGVVYSEVRKSKFNDSGWEIFY